MKTLLALSLAVLLASPALATDVSNVLGITFVSETHLFHRHKKYAIVGYNDGRLVKVSIKQGVAILQAYADSVKGDLDMEATVKHADPI